MRVLVTGSRTWRDGALIAEQLDTIHADHPDTVLVHGACAQGADAIADRWALRRGVTVERHPAEWRRYGRSAGFRRNAEMVQAGVDVCLVFIDVCRKRDCDDPKPHGSHGAFHCADLALTAGIDTRWWTA
jgi:SLOG family YspA-like protein